ncbi:MAG TPA: hypothetical protein VF623_03650 [Segetibacter sp.]|jgi:plasmid stabilization system protein ParE
MVGRKRKVIWDEIPKQFFKNPIIYIRNSSPQNADKVKSVILQSIRHLVHEAEVHPPDKYKENNEKSQFRAFEKLSLRVSFFVSESEIRIVRIRHVKQAPDLY